MNKFYTCIILLHLFFSCNISDDHIDKPNIILIVADDLGYGDLSIFGNKDILTPNIDKLGEEGVVFTDFHSNGSVCSPTRAALLKNLDIKLVFLVNGILVMTLYITLQIKVLTNLLVLFQAMSIIIHILIKKGIRIGGLIIN